MKKLFIYFLFLLFSSFVLSVDAQKDQHETVKKPGRWNLGVLPVLSYNSDLGLQYGILGHLYDYGDREIYPKYYQSIYGEVSRNTKGSWTYRLFYDSEYLIPSVRVTGDLSYYAEPVFDFFGFNGYNSVYRPEFKDVLSPEYKTRMFYSYARNIFSGNVDLQGGLKIDHLKWVAGVNVVSIAARPVPIDRINKGKDEDQKLPAVDALYDKYLKWGVIQPEEATGGTHYAAKLGVVYDTRDNEPCPTSGIWSEIVLQNSFSKSHTYGKLSVTHRQYFPLVSQRLSLAYRLGYQGVVYGEIPFYMLPNMLYSYMPNSVVDGLGGSKSIRGMMRNRAIGNGVVFANVELRYKVVNFKWIKNNWYIALSPFFDSGMVVQQFPFDLSKVPNTETLADYYQPKKERLHNTYGCGLHIAMNENFVIAADVGFPLNKEDGNKGIYIGMNWLF